ncbi:MAG: hypothetical protein BWK73_10380 [Thiothrix lacustris]|uniref:Conjugal transfer protein TraJ n=1 Tax=Thiothrix lacustris TaxID=525917 RepID=A0A1Y1QUD9_9GAMM|nr:MAG: hypothetical protein BWK73_10380 [Thiothrix lacustris]
MLKEERQRGERQMARCVFAIPPQVTAQQILGNLFAYGSTILPLQGVSAVGKRGKMGSETRKKTVLVMVRMTPEEREEIAALAATCSLSVPEFMRRMALSYTPKSTLDAQAIIEMAKINGDIGRVVGLLKLWLSTEAKKNEAFTHNIPKIVNELKELKDLLRQKAMQL